MNHWLPLAPVIKVQLVPEQDLLKVKNYQIKLLYITNQLLLTAQLLLLKIHAINSQLELM